MCYGNICRSPMAEALARKYGSDVLEARSAGLSPSLNTTPETRAVLLEKNVDLGEHLPTKFADVDLSGVDLIVNMSGYRLPGDPSVPVLEWRVRDPIGRPDTFYREVRDDIEMKVMQLILKLRKGKI